MRKLRYLVVVLFVVFLFVMPGNGCGPFFDEAVYVKTADPDGLLSDFAKGHIGILNAGYRIRHLVVSYDWLNGHGLSDAEQKEVLDLDHEVRNSDMPDESLVESRMSLGQEYQNFANCLTDAHKTADKTLADRKAAHGSDKASIDDLVQGQHDVFMNCSGGTDMLPKPAPTNAPLWLQQDRAYQMAAAKFYQTDYDGAILLLRAIAADKSSPWRITSRLVIARAMIRRAFVGQEKETPNNTPGSPENQRYLKSLAANQSKNLMPAREELRRILADSSIAEIHACAQRLLDLVELHLDPAAQAQVLAERLTDANRKNAPGVFRQALLDLRYLATSDQNASLPTPQVANSNPAPEGSFLAWLQGVQDDYLRNEHLNYGVASEDIPSLKILKAKKTALESWRSLHTTPWLIAALMEAKPGEAGNQELIQAALQLPHNSPAWTSATYYRLRLSVNSTATRSELEKLDPTIKASETRSTINLFTQLHRTSAPTLKAFLADAGTVPVGFTEEDYTVMPIADDTQKPADGLCHVTTPPSRTPLFDGEVAFLLNTRMPLAMLADAAESDVLPANLRFDLAQSTWTRAVLLERPEIAKRMSPLLVGCYASWKPWLDKYDASSTPEDRKANGLLALMRFASTRPVVATGFERGFANYSDYRDNWWGDTTLSAQSQTQRTVVAVPTFLTAMEHTQAETEYKALLADSVASDYFAKEALAWQAAHPSDPRTPDILGYAERVIRNAPRSDATKELNHQLFDVVQKKYPQSEWAKKYKTWE